MADYIGKGIHICGLPEPELLELSTVLYNGFGGYSVRKNGELFYEGGYDEDWEKFKKLRDIEKIAKKEPEANWEVELYAPLSGATWKRNSSGKWLCVERNQGFA